MRILISPFSQKLRPPKEKNINPKNYPYWEELIKLLDGQDILQVGVKGEPILIKEPRLNWPLKYLKQLIEACDFWISVDNFFPHLAYHVNKRGVVLWGPSDPNLFGYSTNVNILKDRSYLRPDQYGIWEVVEFDPNRFVKAEEVYKIIQKEFNLTQT